jgi:hypothetical protein
MPTTISPVVLSGAAERRSHPVETTAVTAKMPRISPRIFMGGL